MDDKRFDVLTRMLAASGSRRGMLQSLGVGALATIVGRFVTTGEAEAKKKRGKKKKKCKAGTRACNGGCIPQNNCCLDTDCGQNQICTGGQCVAVNAPQYQNDGDCGAGQRCQDGQCVADVECQNNIDCGANETCLNQTCQCNFPNKPCGDLCCASNEACINGTCVVGQGTCAAAEDICGGNDVACNGNASCTCGIRLDDGEPRCVQFVNDSRTVCTCNNDFRCEQDFGAGTICIKGGASCPDCTLATLGRCARLCPET